ncbi:MAG: cytochrome-c peroxidase [Deltaproteobacteria bacterium]|nr:cytochrome-c peroxidase [Deltaproteobacteria bacterium]
MRPRHLALGVIGAAALAACSSRPPASDLAIVDVDKNGPPPARPRDPGPTYGPTRHLAEAPPPISGGTLLVTRGGYAIASDPDRDRIFVVELATRQVKEIELPARSEPGRAAEDDAGRVHVVVRNRGEVVSIDPKSGLVLARRSVCKMPRGITLAPTLGAPTMLVVCAGGELYDLPTSLGSNAAFIRRIGDDLRDVVVSGDRIYVSTFRSAEVMEIGLDGSVGQKLDINLRKNPSFVIGAGLTRERTPRVAWRMIPSPSGGTPYVLHQLASNDAVPLSSKEPSSQGRTGGYGSGGPVDSPCGVGNEPVVMTSLARPSDNAPTGVTSGIAALPVDVATDGESITLVAAGNGHTPERPQLFTFEASFAPTGRDKPSDPRFTDERMMRGCFSDVGGSSAEVGQLVAAAYAGRGQLVLQSREPAQLVLWPARVFIPLSPESREDTGHAIFHSNSSVGLACASCHAEGGDDAHTWTFDRLGVRRTPSLLGTLEGTAPYHWDGDMAQLGTIADKVFTDRMQGPALDEPQKAVLQDWLFALPPPAPRVEKEVASAVRGKALFEDAVVGCASCHSGPRFTTSASVDVGTGGTFQVPSLVGVGARAPFLHDGCARTLRERFLPRCTTDLHGKTSHLSSVQLEDLVAYLESL